MKNSLFVLFTAMTLCASPHVASLLAGEDLTKHEIASRKKLEVLWSDLYGDDPAAANAIIKLYKQADVSVPFLKEKLQPLALQPDDCRKLLKELGSEDEAVWRSAWEKLDYLDPRLAIDLKTLMDEVTEIPARTRMVEIMSDRPADSLGRKNVSLTTVGDDGFNFVSKGSWWAEHRIERIGGGLWNRKMSWTRACRAVAILEQINTAAATEVLEQLAEGHPDAAPTKAATESLKRMVPAIDPFGKQ